MRWRPDWFLIIAFLFILVAPMTSLPLPQNGILADMNSSQAGFSPRRIFTRVMEFPRAYGGYFNDRYLLHDWQVDAFHWFRLRVLAERQFPNVLIGEGGWLYYTGEDNIRDYECTSPFNQKELAALVDRLMYWDEKLRSRGLDFYILVAPNKETIYPQYLPGGIHSGWSTCRIDQVMRVVNDTPLRVADVRPELNAAAQDLQVYHRTDTHWNDSGALIASAELLELIRGDYPGLPVPSLADYQPEERDFSGDLARFIPADERFIERAVFLEPVDPSLVKYSAGEGRDIFTKKPGSDLPSAVIFRDSFADALIPFLSESFSEAAYIHSFMVDFDQLERLEPDIVILEIAQRYLTVLR